ncbi:uncharacterized protein LOC117105064 [Anneissia japonica]|uniref:uncharacterized protein LOC117105064 n=1 Tax=Anneissia japonica TaxID=1529436 RepID=UPI001425B349|nr:uncharacterized protein LOC117105064 [Anneissia japonica]XP_033101970.1 uncharacterized protein LOC117105064 [Anneissia japonica]
MARNINFSSNLHMIIKNAPSNASLQNAANQCASNAAVLKCSNISAMPLIGATRPGPGQSLHLIPMIIDHKLYYLSSGVWKSTTEIDITYKNYAKVVTPIYLSANTKTANENPKQNKQKIIQQSSKKITDKKACVTVVNFQPSNSGDANNLPEEGRLLANENANQNKQKMTQQEKAFDTVVKIQPSKSDDANELPEEGRSLANENPNQNKQKIILQSSKNVFNEKTCDTVVKTKPSDSDDDLPEEGRSFANENPNQNKQKITQQSSKKVITGKACDIVVKIEPSDSDEAKDLQEENGSTHEESSSFENINLKTEVFCFQGSEIKKETLEETLSNCTTEEDDCHTIIEHVDDDTEQNESIVKSGQKRKVQPEMPIEEPEYTCDSIKSKLRGFMCKKKVFIYKRKRYVYEWNQS